MTIYLTRQGVASSFFLVFARLSKDARAWYRRVLRRAGLDDDRPRALINISLLNPCTFQQPTTRPKDPSHRSARTRDTTKAKVKRSHYRPGVAQRVPGS